MSGLNVKIIRKTVNQPVARSRSRIAAVFPDEAPIGRRRKARPPFPSVAPPRKEEEVEEEEDIGKRKRRKRWRR